MHIICIDCRLSTVFHKKDNKHPKSPKRVEDKEGSAPGNPDQERTLPGGSGLDDAVFPAGEPDEFCRDGHNIVDLEHKKMKKCLHDQ